jgi:hypothetical protein
MATGHLGGWPVRFPGRFFDALHCPLPPSPSVEEQADATNGEEIERGGFGDVQPRGEIDLPVVSVVPLPDDVVAGDLSVWPSRAIGK